MKSSIPIHIKHDEIDLAGRVIFLHPHEIRVSIETPFDQVTASRHTFFNSGDNPERSFSSGGNLTPVGEESARDLLKLIYDTSLLIRQNEADLRREYGPVKERLRTLYSDFKHSVPDFNTGKQEDILLKQHMETLQSILFLNHEFFKTVCEKYPAFRDVGLDTFMELTNRLLD